MVSIGLNSFIRRHIPELYIDLFDILLFSLITAFVLSKIIPLLVTQITKRKIRAKWGTSPRDVVILHSAPRGIAAPCISPFALKLETFLRMAKIPYKYDGEFPFGSKGKTPWITLNGKHMADSQLIIEYLIQKFDIKLGAKYSAAEKAYGRAVRIMIEEHLYWGGVVWRFRQCDPDVLKNMYSPLMNKFNSLLRPLVWKSVVSRFNQMACAQGIGRHSDEEVEGMMAESMRALSKILGNKKFLLGDEPTEEDTAVFGLAAQGLYASPGAPFHVVFEECPNLVAYIDRIKSIYWSDWDDLLETPS